MIRSRLSKRFEQKSQKNLAFSLLGIFVIFFLVFKFGIPFLINFSSFISGSRGKDEVKIQNPSFIAPPVLDSLPQATSSANIAISGLSFKNQTIKLYINDNLIDETKTDNKGIFLFKKTINPGENIIKAKAIAGDKESVFSENIIITFKNAPPSLNIISPTDGQSFSKDQNTAEIKGTTDTDVKVTVNGFWTITDSSGSFSYGLPLQGGENIIKITATDLAGNKNEKEIKINYSP